MQQREIMMAKSIGSGAESQSLLEAEVPGELAPHAQRMF